jgi:pantoate ligase / CMP/dCMP kinase
VSLNRKPIIAIDGPAGAGKSTVAKLVAQQLGLLYLDTGAMYRAIALLVQEANVAIENEGAIAELARKAQIILSPSEIPTSPPLVFVNGIDVTSAIRSKAVTAMVSAIAAQSAVREILVNQQQALGKSGGIVMEGRDIGTHVFPDAEIKVFLTASVRERAQRRHAELVAQSNGEQVDAIALIEAAIQTRDEQDSTRAISPLLKADDAIAVNTDGLTIGEVVTIIVDLHNQKV